MASASHCGLSCISIRAHSVHHTNSEHAGCALLSVTGQGRWFCLVSCPAASVSDSCFLYNRPLSLSLFSQLQKQVNICLGVPSQRGTKKRLRSPALQPSRDFWSSASKTGLSLMDQIKYDLFRSTAWLLHWHRSVSYRYLSMMVSCS